MAGRCCSAQLWRTIRLTVEVSLVQPLICLSNKPWMLPRTCVAEAKHLQSPIMTTRCLPHSLTCGVVNPAQPGTKPDVGR